MMMEDIPVYLFTGFLEAGKTKFINESMSDPNFNDGKRKYPTRLKVIGISIEPVYTGDIVEITGMDLTVDRF